MSSDSYSINNDNTETNLASLSENQIIFDCDELEPVVERIKLEGDEYNTGKKYLDKKD